MIRYKTLRFEFDLRFYLKISWFCFNNSTSRQIAYSVNDSKHVTWLCLAFVYNAVNIWLWPTTEFVCVTRVWCWPRRTSAWNISLRRPFNEKSCILYFVERFEIWFHFCRSLLSTFVINIARQNTDARWWYSTFVRRPSVCPYVCPLRSGILWKRLNILSYFLHHTVAQ